MLPLLHRNEVPAGGPCVCHLCFILKKCILFIYFLESGEEREKERERNINVWLPLTCPHWGAGLQPRHVP